MFIHILYFVRVTCHMLYSVCAKMCHYYVCYAMFYSAMLCVCSQEGLRLVWWQCGHWTKTPWMTIFTQLQTIKRAQDKAIS